MKHIQSCGRHLFLLGMMACLAGGTASAQDFESWDQYLGGVDSSQYSSLDQIDADNVGLLEEVWSYPTGPGPHRFSPTVVDGVMYLLGADNAVVALAADTGQELWVHPNQGAVGNRGISYWESEDGSERRLLYINGGFLTAIDADTGAGIPTFGEGGRVDLRAGLEGDASAVRPLQTSNPGRVFEDLMIVSLPAGAAGYRSSPGDIHAYDVRTGELEWVFHTVPKPGEFGAETWPAGILPEAGGVHNWSELTIDVDRGIAYIPLGSPRYDFYGGNRHGENLFGDSLVALDARTGDRIWHYQLVHHDLWDYDLPTAPKLLTLERDGRQVDVVVQSTKWGYVYVFDRDTGEPFWPIEERPVPPSDVPGEQAWPTQPLPVTPPPFARPAFSIDDLNPYLPEDELAALRERFAGLRDEGLYTPPSLEGSLRHAGGSSWGSSAVDPMRGRLYVSSLELPTVVTLIEPNGRGGRGRGRGAAPPPNANPEFVAYDAPMEFLLANEGMYAIGPPFSRLTAYDLEEGRILWQVPNGEIPSLVERGITETGSQSPRGGPLVTAGGLVFVGTSSDRKLRAYDQESGEVLWELQLDSAVEGVPATYRIGGRQYLVICAAAQNGTLPTGAATEPPPGPGRYVVLALPETSGAEEE